MVKEEIYIRKVIVHIMDNMVGMPILSDTPLEFGSEFADFLKEHIYKVAAGDDSKQCQFYKDQSEIYQMLSEYEDDSFIPMSQALGNALYDIMGKNVEIPSADLMIVRFKSGEDEYLALLKMNYKEFYTHRTMSTESGNVNEVIKYKSILPSESQRLQEAAVINLKTMDVSLIEKKYEVNGEKTNYFSYLFLKCSSRLSDKTKLNIVTKAVESIQEANYDESEQYEVKMRAKAIINETLEEEGGFVVEEIAERIFEEKPELTGAFQETMEKYNMVKEEVKPQSEKTKKKYEKQCLVTDTGIEIKIPMEQYSNTDSVEFITNDNGTISVLIKNIGYLDAKI